MKGKFGKMKKFFVFFLLIFCALIISCDKDRKHLQVIEDYQIFDMEEEAYYIFFVKEDCEYCEAARPEIEVYLNKVMSNPKKYKNGRKVYEVCIKTKDEKSIISRAYDSSNGGGQGTDNKFFVDGVMEWDDLYIASTPSLISIYEVNGVKKAKYLAQGKSKVLEKINSTLS